MIKALDNSTAFAETNMALQLEESEKKHVGRRQKRLGGHIPLNAVELLFVVNYLVNENLLLKKNLLSSVT